MRLTMLKNGDGHSVAIDADEVVYLGPVFAQPNGTNGQPQGPKTLILGKAACLMRNGAQHVLDGTVEGIYAKLRRGESGSILEKA